MKMYLLGIYPLNVNAIVIYQSTVLHLLMSKSVFFYAPAHRFIFRRKRQTKRQSPVVYLSKFHGQAHRMVSLLASIFEMQLGVSF